jgi:hypothetical protein
MVYSGGLWVLCKFRKLINFEQQKEDEGMKTMVKLGVLFAALLLLTGVAFAEDDMIEVCGCYEITATEAHDSSFQETFLATVCLDYETNTGVACTPFGGADLSLFPGSIFKVLAYGDSCVGAFKFHGSDKNVLTGIGHCFDEDWMLWGHKTNKACPLCMVVE